MNILVTGAAEYDREFPLYQNPNASSRDCTYADISKARELLNYNPSVNLEKMVEIYYEWFFKQPEWYKKGEY